MSAMTDNDTIVSHSVSGAPPAFGGGEVYGDFQYEFLEEEEDIKQQRFSFK